MWVVGRILVLSFWTSACAVSALAEAHPEPRGQVVGYYSKGSLHDSSSIDPHGPGFVHLFEKRDRHFGSQGLLDLITQSAARIAARYPEGERLQIGDIAAKNGGAISGHASHQNGLDADIVYYRVNHHEQSAADGDGGFVENFAPAGKVSANLDLERTWEFIKLLDASGRLNRIFVHTAIKKALCSYAKSKDEVDSHADALRRIELLDNHFDHMHVRLSCPSSSPACQKQIEPKPGSGC